MIRKTICFAFSANQICQIWRKVRELWNSGVGSKPATTDLWRMTNLTGILQPIPSRLKWRNWSNAWYQRPDAFPLTLSMTPCEVVETSVTNKGSFQNHPLQNDYGRGTTATPGFKPFAEIISIDSTFFGTSGTIFSHTDGLSRPVNNTNI